MGKKSFAKIALPLVAIFSSTSFGFATGSEGGGGGIVRRCVPATYFKPYTCKITLQSISGPDSNVSVSQAVTLKAGSCGIDQSSLSDSGWKPASDPNVAEFNERSIELRKIAAELSLTFFQRTLPDRSLSMDIDYAVMNSEAPNNLTSYSSVSFPMSTNSIQTSFVQRSEPQDGTLEDLKVRSVDVSCKRSER